MPPPAAADEARILAGLREFFETTDADRRAQLAETIARDPAYERSKITAWLHQAARFDSIPAGQRNLSVRLRDGRTRAVVLRIPHDYDPARPWPLIYALHGTGGTGDGIVHYLKRVLAGAAEEYIIAAPTGYAETVVHADWPPTGEHQAVLAAVRRAVHVDSDRVFSLGYSRGGHTSWTLAATLADQFAGLVPMAGSFVLPEVDVLWDAFLPNLANTHVLCVWGANDTLGNDQAASPEGGIAGLNRRLRSAAEQQRLPIVFHEDPDMGHGDVLPPADALQELLAQRRVHYPRTVRQTVRYLGHAHAYWLEGHAWRGSQWTDKLPTVRVRPAEDVREALARTFRSTLGEMRGTINGQTIDVRRKKIAELTIWIGDGMIDWTQDVAVHVSGRKRYEGKLEPDLFVCLAQAARTYDFDRLRWAGLRFKSGKKIELVTGRTAFPPPEAK